MTTLGTTRHGAAHSARVLALAAIGACGAPSPPPDGGSPLDGTSLPTDAITPDAGQPPDARVDGPDAAADAQRGDTGSPPVDPVACAAPTVRCVDDDPGPAREYPT